MYISIFQHILKLVKIFPKIRKAQEKYDVIKLFNSYYIYYRNKSSAMC